MARKMKLTKQLIDEAEKWIKAGNYNTTVCKYLGIHESTWYKWLQEGEHAKSGIKREFFERIKKAESHSEMRSVQMIQKAGEQSWQALGWYLERKFPDRWGKKDQTRLEHTGKDGEAIKTETNQQIDLSNLSDEELKDLENIIKKSTNDRSDKKGKSET